MVMMTPAKIRALRTALGLTQVAFARLLGVTQNSVARWELDLGHPNYKRQEAMNAMAIEKGIDLASLDAEPAKETEHV